MVTKQDNTGAFIAIERAIDELRRQRGVIIREDGGHAIANYPAEFLDNATLSRLHSPFLALLVTAARAQTLGLPEHDLKIEAKDLTFAQVQSICDPTAPAVPLPALVHREASAIDSMALKLAKHAAILPALLLANVSEIRDKLLEVGVPDVRHYLEEAHGEVLKTAQARLPVEGAENASLASFRTRHGTAVHLALVVGDIDAQNPPLARIHSSCVTGDILESLRCDCGDQLKLAMAAIREAGSGILIYLNQEGRGIGITNKLRSYKLQEMGFDTFTANRMLGFDEDERDFSIAAAILKMLGIGSIRLLTNNPQKLSAMEKAGIRITQRVPLVSITRPHNHAYIDAKAKKAGHLF